MKTRIVPIQKNGADFAAGDRVWFDRELKLATATPPVDGLLCGLCAADAPSERFAVLAHIPIAEPHDLKVIQCVNTGRRMADGSEIVQPVMVHRRFKPNDDPQRDRHPVEFLEECLQAGTAELGRGAHESLQDWIGMTEDQLPGVEHDDSHGDPGAQEIAAPAE